MRVYEKVSKEANWLIEEFMLLANKSVAEFIATSGKMNGREDKNGKNDGQDCGTGEEPGVCVRGL